MTKLSKKKKRIVDGGGVDQEGNTRDLVIIGLFNILTTVISRLWTPHR